MVYSCRWPLTVPNNNYFFKIIFRFAIHFILNHVFSRTYWVIGASSKDRVVARRGEEDLPFDGDSVSTVLAFLVFLALFSFSKIHLSFGTDLKAFQ